jgi:hypothetical protein
MLWIKALLVLLATASTDLFWTLYITNAAEGHKWRAALSSAMIILVGSLAVVEYVNNRWMIVPAAIGAFLGTLLPLHLKRKKQE